MFIFHVWCCHFCVLLHESCPMHGVVGELLLCVSVSSTAVFSHNQGHCNYHMQYQEASMVDPLKYLCEMRQDRGGMIQTQVS